MANFLLWLNLLFCVLHHATLLVAFPEIVPMPFMNFPAFHIPIIMAVQATTPCVGILLSTFQASSMLPHFGIHVNEAGTHKYIRFTNMSTYFKCHNTSTCIQHPSEDDSNWLHSFLLHLIKLFRCPSALACTSHILESWYSKQPHVTLRHHC
jgi:hypothetical protein